MHLTCTSQIASVTVHARGALITRQIALPAELPDGDVDLVCPGVTPLAEGGSVRAALSGSSRSVVSVKMALFVPETPAVAGKSVEEVRSLEAQIERLQAELTRLASRRELLLNQPLVPVLRPASPVEHLGTRIADALGSSALVSELVADLDARVLVLGERLRELGEKRDAAALRDAQASSTERMGSGHPTRRITVRLSGGGPVAGAEVTYAVPAARWWPIYTLRLAEGGQRAAYLLMALVAQLSGEDWTGAELFLSTADLIYDARMPELPSLRLGRAQPPPRRAYRPPPAGLARMFEGYDQVFGAIPGPVPPAGGKAAFGMADKATTVRGETTRLQSLGDRRDESAPQGEIAEKTDRNALMAESLPPPPPGAFGTGAMPTRPMAAAQMPPSQGASIMPAMAAPMAMRSMPAKRRGGLPFADMLSGAAPQFEGYGGDGGGGGGAPAAPAPPEPEPAIEPQDAWLDFDSLVLGPASDRQRRGRLSRDPQAGGAGERSAKSARIEALAPLGNVKDPRLSRGMFDHRYRADGLAEVPSDGQPHRVMLGTAAASPTLLLRTVPREAAEVYREVELQNPFDAPLLSGPVDVYLDGSLLVQTAIERIDRGGTLRVGMGVEDRVRVARNVRVEEEAAGVLGGSTAMIHTVSIEIVSSLGKPAAIEVLDRTPVTDDKSVEVKRVFMRPEPAAYTQADRGAPIRGGWLWRLNLLPGQKALIEFQYRVTFSAKNEIVGGNRRD